MNLISVFLNSLLIIVASNSDIVGVCGQCQDWQVMRLNENSPLYFMNTSVSNTFVLSCWVWKDSRSGGTWDSRLRIGLNGNDTKGGGFNYRDGLGRETLTLRWVEQPGGNVTWRASTSTYFPVSSWNISAMGSTWGYSTSSDGRWYFYMDNKTIEPSTMPVTSVLVVPQRWRRSDDYSVDKNTITFSRTNQRSDGTPSEFFQTVTTIFSTVIGAIASTITSAFSLDFLNPGGSSIPNFTPTPDPDSEMVTKTSGGNFRRQKILKNV